MRDTRMFENLERVAGHSAKDMRAIKTTDKQIIAPLVTILKDAVPIASKLTGRSFGLTPTELGDMANQLAETVGLKLPLGAHWRKVFDGKQALSYHHVDVLRRTMEHVSQKDVGRNFIAEGGELQPIINRLWRLASEIENDYRSVELRVKKIPTPTSVEVEVISERPHSDTVQSLLPALEGKSFLSHRGRIAEIRRLIWNDDTNEAVRLIKEATLVPLVPWEVAQCYTHLEALLMWQQTYKKQAIEVLEESLSKAPCISNLSLWFAMSTSSVSSHSLDSKIISFLNGAQISGNTQCAAVLAGMAAKWLLEKGVKGAVERDLAATIVDVAANLDHALIPEELLLKTAISLIYFLSSQNLPVKANEFMELIECRCHITVLELPCIIEARYALNQAQMRAQLVECGEEHTSAIIEDLKSIQPPECAGSDWKATLNYSIALKILHNPGNGDALTYFKGALEYADTLYTTSGAMQRAQCLVHALCYMASEHQAPRKEMMDFLSHIETDHHLLLEGYLKNSDLRHGNVGFHNTVMERAFVRAVKALLQDRFDEVISGLSPALELIFGLAVVKSQQLAPRDEKTLLDHLSFVFSTSIDVTPSELTGLSQTFMEMRTPGELLDRP